jgi:hypothetical protein
MLRAGAILFLLASVLSPRGWLGLANFREQGGGPQALSTFEGQIMDSKCAAAGTHDPMMKKLNAKDARDCTLRCAKDASFVLYNSDSKTVYQLNDQSKPVRFAGQKVRISGTYEKESQTIVVGSIDGVSPDSPAANFPQGPTKVSQ